MKKEVSLAILIGLFLGLIVTYGVYRAKQGDDTTNVLPTATPLPTALPPLSTSLVLTSPVDESVVFEPNQTLAGTTWPNAFVVVLLNGEETVTTADTTGNFSAKLSLQTEANIIQIFSTNEDGETENRELTVIYSKEEESSTASASAQTQPR